MLSYIERILNQGTGKKKSFQFIRKFVESLPSIQPKPKTDALDKIRAEIEQLPTKTMTNWNGCCPDFDNPEIEYVTKNKLLKIIDKYRAESEE